MEHGPGELEEPTWLRIRRGLETSRPRLVRQAAIGAARSFFTGQGFHEVETPLLVRSPGMEPYLEVFSTCWLDNRGERHHGFLTTSPEYAMKKLLAAGIAPIFQIAKSFRNREDTSARHNPEFTILEWYRVHADYRDIMSDCEELFRHVARTLEPAGGGKVWRYQGRVIDLGSSWERLTVRDAFRAYADLDVEADPAAFLRQVAKKGYAIEAETTWEQAYHQVFLNEIEPRLGWAAPTILQDYPLSMAALARVSPANPNVAERFELYVAGIEMANAFSELVDPIEQAHRLAADQEERRRLGRTAYGVDTDFLRALAVGIPPSAGIALGVDRLAMFFADVQSIRDVLWFTADEIFGPIQSDPPR